MLWALPDLAPFIVHVVSGDSAPMLSVDSALFYRCLDARALEAVSGFTIGGSFGETTWHGTHRSTPREGGSRQSNGEVGRRRCGSACRAR